MVDEILLVLYLLSEVSEGNTFTQASHIVCTQGVVLCLWRDLQQKWMTADFSQAFISVAPSCWQVNSADQMLLVSGKLLFISSSVVP